MRVEQASAKEKCELDVALADARARAAAAEDKIASQAATLKEQAEHVHNLEVCNYLRAQGLRVIGPSTFSVERLMVF